MNLNNLPAAFWDRVQPCPLTGCWNWAGSINHTGYALFKYKAGGAVHFRAHRVAYMLAVGPIPNGLVVDHQCNNRGCVNPNHLKVMTQRENLLRSERTPNGISRKNWTSGVCPFGHPLTPDNIMVLPTRRCCRTCVATWQKAHSAKKRAERRAERQKSTTKS